MADAEIWAARLSPADAVIVWPKVAAMLAPAIAGSGGLYLPDDVRDLVTSPGSWSLWIGAERDQLLAAWTTTIKVYPQARVLEVVHGGGTQIEKYYELGLSMLEEFARQTGCSRLHCAGRRGWSRTGWSHIGYWHERKIA